MSTVPRLSRRLLTLATIVAASCATSAHAAQRVETISVPSNQGNVDVATVKLNKVTSLNASVVLPDGYDADPAKDWPVLYLLAGVGDNHTGWITSGQIPALAKDLPAIVVLPESGRGFLMDWYNEQARAAGNWGRYTLGEVIPAIHARYRVRPGRQFHAIGGISMGGYGALLLAGQLPGYFGTAVSLSGMIDAQNPESYALLPSETGASSYEAIWGPVYGAYATANNPIKVAENLYGTRVYLHTGSGVPDPFVPFNADAWSKGVAIEGFTLAQNTRYALELQNAGVQHAFRVRVGVHEWAYWRRELPRAIQWGLFAAPRYVSAAAATRWDYRTMAQRGNAWGFGFQFAERPSSIVSIQRRDTAIVLSGTGRVTVNPGAPEWDASGAGTKPACSFTADLPVTRTLPADCFGS